MAGSGRVLAASELLEVVPAGRVRPGGRKGFCLLDNLGVGRGKWQQAQRAAAGGSGRQAGGRRQAAGSRQQAAAAIGRRP